MTEGAPIDPRKVSQDIEVNRRHFRLRSDADTMRRAADIADKMNCPAVSNACADLAKTLYIEANASLHKVETITPKDGTV